MLLVYLVGMTGRATATPVRVLLAGVAVGAVMDGIGYAVRLRNPRAFDNMRFWDAGALDGRSLEVAGAIAPFIAVGAVLCLVVGRSLNVTALGDDLAKSMGGNVARTQALSLVAVTLLAGAATAGAGPIGFVGLMVPHAVRRFTGPDWRWMLALRHHRRARPAAGRRHRRTGHHPACRTTGRHRHRVPRCAGSDLADPQARSGPHMTIIDNDRARVEFGRRQCIVRVGAVSARASWRAIIVVATLLVGAAGIAVLAIGLGKYTVAPGDVIGVLLGTNTSFDRVVVLEWRMPRMLMALLIGAALGVSGAIFQALTRNALGSPDIIGVTSGAYTGALVVIAGTGGGYYAVAAGALVGGLLTAVVVYALSYRNGLAGFRLIVVGIAVSAVVNSVNQWIVIKIDFHTAVTASVWQPGHAQRTELDSGAADDGLPGRHGRGCWSLWDRSCRCCRWATTPRVRSACGPNAPAWPISSSASAWWRWLAPRQVRSRSSRWPRHRSPAGSPPALVSAWCRRRRWARYCC